MEEKKNTPEEKPIILEGIAVEFNKENKGGPLYTEEQYKIDPDKSLEEATKDAGSEMSAEDQQAILKEILAQSKRRSSMSLLKKPAKQVSLKAEKKRKAKNKAQKKSRKINRKK